MAKPSAPANFVNKSSHKYLLRKIDKEIKAAHGCNSMQVMINYVEFVNVMKSLGYLNSEKTETTSSKNKAQMLDMWDIIWGCGSPNEDHIKIVNVKRLVCALEGIPTNELLPRKIDYEGFRDQNNNFFAD